MEIIAIGDQHNKHGGGAAFCEREPGLFFEILFPQGELLHGWYEIGENPDYKLPDGGDDPEAQCWEYANRGDDPVRKIEQDLESHCAILLF